MLERDSYPRLQMSLLVAITGGAGFLASYLLLRVGLTEIWLRYVVAIGIAYLVFLGLLWLWMRTRADDYLDIPDVLPHGSSSSGPVRPVFEGKGGESGGGGASGRFDLAGDAGAGEFPEAAAKSLGEVVGHAAEADEFAIPLIALAVLAAILAALFMSSVWIIYSAPLLFAELLVDGVLAVTLYRRLRRFDERHWLETAVRRTWGPFLAVASIAALAGWAMSLYAPEAKSLGDVLLHARSVR